MSNMLFVFKPLFFFAFLLLTMPLSISYAVLDAKSLSTIKGSAPRLTPEIEAHLDDVNLLGIKMDDKDIFYGEDAENIPSSIVAYPFVSRFTAALPRKPNANEFVDENGDEIGDVIPASSYKLTWYYTDSNNKLVEFVPTAKDTFCSLSKANKLGPYKLRVTGGLTLTSKKGDPRETVYPNDQQTTVPSKLFTVIESAGLCYAKPELNPKQALGVSAMQWDDQNGFLIQSNRDAESNFPKTAFYGATFDIVPAQADMIAKYDWQLTKGNELASIQVKAATVTISFNTEAAKNTATAWNYVVGGNGYPVTLEGKHKITGKTIQYPFKIKDWFAGFDKNQVPGKASYGSVETVVSGCESLDGIYRLANSPEVSNAPYGQVADVTFTREIGLALSEWGDVNQINAPNSWAAAQSQSNLYKRLWLYDPALNQYCDLHTYEAKYHCRNSKEKKNGLCIAVKSR